MFTKITHSLIMFTLWFLVYLVAADLTHAESKPCRTPTDQKGECKTIDTCPFLLSILIRRPLTRDNADFVRSHNCGFQNLIPKVCCPLPYGLSGSTNLLPNSSTCGYSTSTKIFGGEKTGIDEFPWMTILEYQLPNGSIYFDCGGALISKRYVLTAAHCINHRLMSVRLGEYDTALERDCTVTSLGEDCAPPPIKIPVEKNIVHEDYVYDEFNQYEDIALVRLTQDVPFSEFVRPICLPVVNEESSRSYTGEKLFVAGWGITENNSVSTVKLKVQLPVRDNSFCEQTYRSHGFNLTLRDTQLCVGAEKGKDSCRGDSGGPLMTVRRDKNKDNQWYAAGVVSFGPEPCAMENWGGVYTRVSNYVPWIVSQLRP